MDVGKVETSRMVTKMKSSTDWDNWYANIRSYAKLLDIWVYIDPDNEMTPPLEPRPKDILPSDINPTYNTFDEITDADMPKFRVKVELYKIFQAKYEEQINSLFRIRNAIQQTVDHEYVCYALQKDNVREMLLTLKKRFEVPEKYRRAEVIQRYMQLKNWQRNINVFDWLDQWQMVYYKLNELQIINLNQIKNDFVIANSDIDPIYSAQWHDEADETSFEDIIKAFREYYTRHSLRLKLKGAAFETASSQNEPPTQEPILDRKPQQKSKPSCACGKQHYYHECPYYNENVRGANWKPKKDIEEEVEKLLGNSRVKRMVTASLKRANKKADKSTDQISSVDMSATVEESDDDTLVLQGSFQSAVLATNSEYGLRNSFIFGTAADTHICNQRDRFTSLSPMSAFIYTGNSQTQVEGKGDAFMWMTSPTGERCRVTLKGALFVPNFHTSIVSGTKAKEAGYRFDSWLNQLCIGKTGKVVAKLDIILGMWVLEYNDVNPSAFALAEARGQANAPTALTRKASAADEQKRCHRANLVLSPMLSVFDSP